MTEKISLKIKTTHQFEKDLKLVLKQGKDINKFYKVVHLLMNKETIPEVYKDHRLNNDEKFKNCRELHIEFDWILVYKIHNDELILSLLRTGSHSNVL